jgi:hypothetical protein
MPDQVANFDAGAVQRFAASPTPQSLHAGAASMVLHLIT